MPTTFAKSFGGAIAIVLLVLYVGIIIFLSWNVAACGNKANCAVPPKLNSGTTYVFNTINGLISALVVAALAITKPGDNPATRWVGPNASDFWKNAVNVIIGAYLVFWCLAGLSALIIGVMLYPSINSTLSDAGTGWLGLAIASGYAYFGIRPEK